METVKEGEMEISHESVPSPGFFCEENCIEKHDKCHDEKIKSV
jgi:hypothetical protein